MTSGVECSVCGVFKPNTEFHQSGGKRHGRQCKLCRSAKQVKRQQHDPKYADRLRGWRGVHADEERERSANRRLKEKVDVLAAYGGARCAVCGDTELSNLELDHVDGDGNQHRGQLRQETGLSTTMSGWIFYQTLRLREYPQEPRLQVLCRPCHKVKNVEDLKKANT